MNTKLKTAAVVAAFSALSALAFVSCKKEEDDDAGTLPQITLATDAGYLAKDTTVSKGATVKVGVRAAKTEANDVLVKFNQTVSFNGAADSTLQTTSLSSSQGDAYNNDINITARNVAGTEKYTFTVVNKDGLINSVSVKLTVQ